MMGRSLDEVIATIPESRRRNIEHRFNQLVDEVESLRELRLEVGAAQADIAASLNIKQPSVSKIEKQADMYLSTLKGYIEAMGGELDLIVRFPAREPIRLERLGDLTVVQSSTGRRVERVRRSGQAARRNMSEE